MMTMSLCLYSSDYINERFGIFVIVALGEAVASIVIVAKVGAHHHRLSGIVFGVGSPTRE